MIAPRGRIFQSWKNLDHVILFSKAHLRMTLAPLPSLGWRSWALPVVRFFANRYSNGSD